MEGLENGYDSYSVVRPHPPSDGSQESDMDEEEQARLQAERRAEKRRRKEERAARKARKESKRLDRDNAEQGVEGVSSSPVDRAIAEVDRDEVEEDVNGAEVVDHGRHDESRSQKTKKKKSKRDDQAEMLQQPSVTTHDRDDDVDVDISIQELPSAQPDPSSHTDVSSRVKKRKSRPSEAVDEVEDKSSTKKAKSKKAAHPPTDVFTEHADPVLVQPSSSAAGPSQTNADRTVSSDTNGPLSQNEPSSSRKKAGGQSSGQSTSTPRPKAPKAPGTSAKGTPRKEEKETDDELRRKFRDQGAMNAWLADQWRDSKELQRLEGLGILKCVRGKFTSEEKAAIKAHFELFKRVNRIDDHELVDLIMAKGRGSQRKEFPKFWPEVAAQAPGRPVKAVKDFVKREFDPRGYKGAWTPEEDEALLRAYSVHPNEWAHIANIVDRTETDCRDRYRNELVSRDTRTKGHWDRREEQELVKIIKEVNEQVGNDPLGYEAPWDIVSERMGGKRSRTQCRKKWQEQLRIVEMSRGEKSTFQNSDRGVLIQRLKRFHLDSEKEINWQSLCNGYWTALPVTSLRAAFWRMKKEIPNQETMGFDDLLHALEVKYPVKAGQEPKERRVSSLPMIQSDHEDDPAEYESEEGEDGAEVDAEV